MRCFVTISFVPGQQDAIAARMSAEQAHVRELMAQGVIKAIYIAADQSRVWLEMAGESPERVRQAMTSFPLFPYMQLEITPLLEIAANPTAPRR